MLHPLDIVVGLKAHLWAEADPWSFQRLAARLAISPSQAHTSLRRLEAANLYRRSDRSLRSLAFVSFAAYGIPHIFPATPGPVALGMPTAHAALPLRERLIFAEPFVWPADGGVKGRAVEPLHPCVPGACSADPDLYAALALLDALRVGRARDRSLAVEELEQLLAKPGRDLDWLARQRDALAAR
ncbi:MAG: hypothetical protein EA397_02545 [Deltaproteobacteria bacterium]|nr:MAG: hypothetical protein EA397_02545 [Deltaproteobacteria bacterium]